MSKTQDCGGPIPWRDCPFGADIAEIKTDVKAINTGIQEWHVRLDRLEQSEARRTWAFRAMFVAVLSLVLNSLRGMFK